ncbi:MAG: helix-turn-helix domain-containing protein [Gammaproteobacteria bacterium]|nr:helix-turn-helix domain-containing protein [Gammaproteobacteria bacterium]
MYLSGEDFYLYCYSVFVILDSLGCRDGKYFRDYRKLAFLTDIIGDDKIVYVISHSSGEKLNPKDYECLLDSYSNGLTLRSEILKLLFVLEKRGYVSLNRGRAQEIDVTLTENNLPSGFLNSNVFESESKNMKDVSKKVGRLASLTLDTMLNKLYVENGVRTWV